jgi:hypothetical protein
VQSPAFWRDLEARFRALPDPMGSLAALEMYDGTWILSGQRDKSKSRSALRQQFSALAIQAAQGAGLSDGTGQPSVDAWLNHVKSGPRYEPAETEVVSGPIYGFPLEGGLISSVVAASAECCVLHATEAALVTVGDRINCLRQDSGLTVDALAELVDLARSSVLEHLASRAQPRPDTLCAYASVFSERLGRDVTVAELLGNGDASVLTKTGPKPD